MAQCKEAVVDTNTDEGCWKEVIGYHAITCQVSMRVQCSPSCETSRSPDNGFARFMTVLRDALSSHNLHAEVTAHRPSANLGLLTQSRFSTNQQSWFVECLPLKRQTRPILGKVSHQPRPTTHFPENASFHQRTSLPSRRAKRIEISLNLSRS